MKYFHFKLAKESFALEIDDSFELEPTQINKTVYKENNNLLVGEINYRNEIIDVYDIALYFTKEELKKFDGILFIKTDNRKFGIKFDGFYKIENTVKDSRVLSINKLLDIIST